MTAGISYTSATYQAFTEAWKNGCVNRQALQKALHQTDNLEDRAIAQRLSYAVRRGWVRLEDCNSLHSDS